MKINMFILFSIILCISFVVNISLKKNLDKNIDKKRCLKNKPTTPIPDKINTKIQNKALKGEINTNIVYIPNKPFDAQNIDKNIKLDSFVDKLEYSKKDETKFPYFERIIQKSNEYKQPDIKVISIIN